jgi:hypothetical protein
MKYIIQAELDPDTGMDVEAHPERIQAMVDQWQALKPIGFYFALTRRAVTIIVDAPSEDAFFEQLHALWDLTKDYPLVWPVAGVDEFPQIMQRVGITR